MAAAVEAAIELALVLPALESHASAARPEGLGAVRGTWKVRTETRPGYSDLEEGSQARTGIQPGHRSCPPSLGEPHRPRWVAPLGRPLFSRAYFQFAPGSCPRSGGHRCPVHGPFLSSLHSGPPQPPPEPRCTCSSSLLPRCARAGSGAPALGRAALRGDP